MRILAIRRVGLAGLIAIGAATGVLAQNQPVTTLGGTGQSGPEAQTGPVSGITFDAPRDLNLNAGSIEIQDRPSDALGLQFYGSGLLASPAGDGEGERVPDSRLPGR